MPYYEVELEDSMRIQVSSLNGHEWSEYRKNLLSAVWEAKRATPDSDYATVLAIIKSNRIPTKPHEKLSLTRWRLQVAKQLQRVENGEMNNGVGEKGETPRGRVDEGCPGRARGRDRYQTRRTRRTRRRGRWGRRGGRRRVPRHTGQGRGGERARQHMRDWQRLTKKTISAMKRTSTTYLRMS